MFHALNQIFPWSGRFFSVTAALFFGSLASHRAEAAEDTLVVFPTPDWAEASPASQGMNADVLDALARRVGGMGCVIRNGYVVQSWRNLRRRLDWQASAAPVFTTLLFFAIEEGRVAGMHEKVGRFLWTLDSKDQSMELRHLVNMTSGYARLESPGQAWAYNDYALNLFQMTLFDRIYSAPGSYVMLSKNRLGGLSLTDHPAISPDNRHLIASPRDMAKIAWFWCQKGAWDGHQLLPAHYFERWMKPQTPKDLPESLKVETNDYLGVGTLFGGDSTGTSYGAGIYGGHWWFNAVGRLHPDTPTWPSAPADTVMTMTPRGNNIVIIPSLNLVMVTAVARWGEFLPGDAASGYNEILGQLTAAVE